STDRDRWLALVPRDTVQVRDGRSFDAGAGGVSHTVRPWPSTVAGALVGALGGEPESVRGPVLAHQVDKKWVLHLPTPLDLVRETRSNNVWRLRLRNEDTTPSATDGTGSEVSCDLTADDQPAEVRG